MDLSPVTLILCLWAASITAGTRSSEGLPCSSATPGGYQDRTTTPGIKSGNALLYKQHYVSFNVFNDERPTTLYYNSQRKTNIINVKYSNSANYILAIKPAAAASICDMWDSMTSGSLEL